jgi:hypothetical protein
MGSLLTLGANHHFHIISATFPRRGSSAEIMYFLIISSSFPQYFRRCGNMMPRGCNETYYMRKEKVNYSEWKSTRPAM